MPYGIDRWQWKWHGTGTSDAKSGRGRTYYKSVEAYRESDDLTRIYNVGDTVNMSGDEEQVWIAQIVDFFQVLRDDDDLRRILRTDTRYSASNGRYELMRCTLRWFYNPEDMNEGTLRRSTVPRQIRNEIYFSDHVEISGFNSVTVIDGMAWVFPSKVDKNSWLREPHPRYISQLDVIKIARTFVNSASPDLTVRQLDQGELQYHLAHPCSAKNLFETGRQRMRGKFTAAGSIVRPSMKTLGTNSGKKQRRLPRAPINLVDDDDDDDWDETQPLSLGVKKNESNLEGSLGKGSASKERQSWKDKRRNTIVDDDYEDDDLQPNDVVKTHTGPTYEEDLEARQKAELQAAQSEVLDMVNELNQSVADFDPGDTLASANPFDNEEDVVRPVVTEKLSSDKLSRADTVKESSAAQASKVPVSATLQQKTPSSNVPLQKRASASSVPYTAPSLPGLQKKKAVNSGHVIVIDDGNDSDEAPQRMQPSITPRRGRIRDVSNPLRESTKRRPPFMPTARDRKMKSSTEKKSTTEKRPTSEGKEPSLPTSPIRVAKEREKGAEGEAAKKVRRNQQSSSEIKATERRTSRQSTLDDELEKLAESKGEFSKRRRIGKLQQGEVAREDLKSKGGKDKRDHLDQLKNDSGDAANYRSDLSAHKQGKDVASEAKAAAQREVTEEDEIDWWNETTKVLQMLKAGFQDMSPAAQSLFSTHVDVVFDLAVRRVTEMGLFGKVDIQNEHLSTIANGIVDDLRKIIAKDSMRNGAASRTEARGRKGQEIDVVRV